jgi:hypothetical protein
MLELDTIPSTPTLETIPSKNTDWSDGDGLIVPDDEALLSTALKTKYGKKRVRTGNSCLPPPQKRPKQTTKDLIHLKLKTKTFYKCFKLKNNIIKLFVRSLEL